MSELLNADQERAVELVTLVSAIGTADAETLLELRRLLLSAMYPSMREPIRRVVLPLFALVTLEAHSIDQGLQRIGEGELFDADRHVRRGGPNRLRPIKAR